MARYTPPIKVKTLEVPWKVLVVRADPEFERDRTREVFYEFSGRTFRGDNTRKGPYDDS